MLKKTTPEFKKTIPEKGAESKSFADVFDSLLTDWRKLSSFLLMLFFIASLIFLSIIMMNKYSGSAIREIELSASGPKVIFETKSSKGNTQYLLMVHPQGWQNTGIRIEAKSKISFKATGMVNIDGGGLFRTMSDRRDLEDRIKKERNLDEKSKDEKQTPEYYFTEEQKKKALLLRPWLGPSGRNLTSDTDVTQITYGNRADRLELKGENLGCLIGKIEGSDDAFKIGKELLDYTPKTSGNLWLNVNDVKNLRADEQQMFYQDNLGFFWVVVTIEPI